MGMGELCRKIGQIGKIQKIIRRLGTSSVCAGTKGYKRRFRSLSNRKQQPVMRTFKKYLALVFNLLVYAFVFGQNPELELQKVLEKLDRGESVEHMQINLGDINFAIGAATLEPGAKLYLDKVAKLLLAAPNMDLLIKGHADNTGSATVNEKLAADRANAVRNHLVAQNIAADRLEASGFGSSMPVADNQTPLGRAKNRRVELEILKRAAAATLQDIIVLRNGERVGAMVRTFDTSRIYYRQFSNADEQQIGVGEVEKILFADGRVVYFDAPVATRQPPSPKPVRRGYSFDPFGESEAFHPGQFVVGMGLGIGNNIEVRTVENKLTLPPVWLTLELPIGHNLGVGLSAGAMMWSPKSDDATRLSYYSLSPRIAYHFNLGAAVDLYGGVGVAGRLVTLQVKRQDGTAVSISKNNVDVAAFGGIRYYFGSFFGLCAEYGNDNVSCARAGLSLRFGG